jgi:hypothetical protein
VVTAVCAAAFLFVGVAHSGHHFNTAMPAMAQADVGSIGDPAGSPSKAAVALENCHGCALTAIAFLGPSIAPIPPVVDHPPATLASRRPHPPFAETPPPIITI